MALDHPSLVQRKLHIFLGFVDKVIEQWDEDDPRIEATVKLAKAVQALDPNLRTISCL